MSIFHTMVVITPAIYKLKRSKLASPTPMITKGHHCEKPKRKITPRAISAKPHTNLPFPQCRYYGARYWSKPLMMEIAPKPISKYFHHTSPDIQPCAFARNSPPNRIRVSPPNKP